MCGWVVCSGVFLGAGERGPGLGWVGNLLYDGVRGRVVLCRGACILSGRGVKGRGGGGRGGL